MLAKALAASLGLMLLSGCAGNVVVPPLSAEHPAHPEAAQAPLPPPSQTLALGDAAPAAKTHPATHDHGQAQHDHATHQHGGTAGGTAGDHAHHGHAAHAATAPSTQPSSHAVYACPHHPEVTSDKPDQRCPKCNMKLVRKAGPATVPAATKPVTPPKAPGHEGH